MGSVSQATGTDKRRSTRSDAWDHFKVIDGSQGVVLGGVHYRRTVEIGDSALSPPSEEDEDSLGSIAASNVFLI